MARGLRRYLGKAGVGRTELHATTATHKKLTFHDLRSKGLTWLAVRGDDALKIQQRAGHTDFKTTQEYIRLAELLLDGFGKPFPPLPPELCGAAPASLTLSSKTKPKANSEGNWPRFFTLDSG